MLRLIRRLLPVGLHRAGYRLAHRLRTRWLRWRGGRVYGVSVVARDAGGRVLLVRHSYGSGAWCFPGGGSASGEPRSDTARREFREELGCELGPLEHLGQVEEGFHGATNVIDVFTAPVAGEPRADGRELVDARFFALDALPEPLAGSALRRLAMLQA